MAFTGKRGTAFKNGAKICDTSKWTFEPSVAVGKYVSNCTNGFKKSVDGAGDSKGTIEIKVDENGKIPMVPGNRVTLALHVDDSGNNYYEVPAMVSTTPIEVDFASENPVAMTFNFEGDGPWTGHGTCEQGSATCCVSSSSGG